MTVTSDPLLAPLDNSLPLPVAVLMYALDAVAALSPADLEPAVALQVTSTVLVAQGRLRALALRHVADVDTRGLHDVDGVPSTGGWVAQQQTSMPRAHVGLARQLDLVPHVAAAVAAGELCLDGAVHVQQAPRRVRPQVDRPDGLIDGQPGDDVIRAVVVDGVCSLVGEARGGLPDDHLLVMSLLETLMQIALRPAAEIDRLERAFLVLARHLEPGQLKQGLAVLTDALLPNQLADSADDAERNRHLALRKHVDRDGWTVCGELDDETGELLETALRAVEATDPDNPADTAAAAQARAADEEISIRIRSRGQRRHDALRLLLQRLLASKVLGSRGKMPVQINVTIPLGALHDEPGAM
ncbi:MAG: DUF222 domain-containing protein, partial [Actinobacteria bacterium]|nr:DUF222 domain-containing protein [Actinomycetota bacterium]MCA1719694.1 DUF222 domain-containing protein [Actinomycetota bacterium]